MKNRPKPSLLEDALGLLVQHFGVERVRSALAKVSVKGADELRDTKPKPIPTQLRVSGETVSHALESIQGAEPDKHRLLSDFHNLLNVRGSLPDPQDIRHFAQLIGLKRIEGKSRKEMIPTLMRFLLTLPTEQLRVDIQHAANISERERQQGFSVLTDKLLGEK